MCRRTTCTVCGKPTFSGCGAHVEQVLHDVPPDRRCKCREDTERSAKDAAPKDPSKPWWKPW